MCSHRVKPPVRKNKKTGREDMRQRRKLAACLKKASKRRAARRAQTRKIAQKNRTLMSTADLPDSFASEGAVLSGSSLVISAAPNP